MREEIPEVHDATGYMQFNKMQLPDRKWDTAF